MHRLEGVEEYRQQAVRVHHRTVHWHLHLGDVPEGEGGVCEVGPGGGEAGVVLADEDISKAGGFVEGEVRGEDIEQALEERDGEERGGPEGEEGHAKAVGVKSS